MGFRISLLAAKADKAVLLAQLGLTDTRVADDANEAPLSAAALPNGWTIVWANDGKWADAMRLDGMTPRPPVATLMVHEGVMAAHLRVNDAHEQWSVGYGLEREGELTGDWPARFASIVSDARERAQADEDGEVDHLFDVPVAMMEAVTGYRYDAVAEANFTVVERGAVAKRPWWKLA